MQLAALHLRKAMRGSAVRTLRLWGSLAGITCFCVQHYTLAHPFLLADNRCLLRLVCALIDCSHVS